eukprot:366073-Chlamydomonas_euryale.AAC.8
MGFGFGGAGGALVVQRVDWPAHALAFQIACGLSLSLFHHVGPRPAMDETFPLLIRASAIRIDKVAAYEVLSSRRRTTGRLYSPHGDSHAAASACGYECARACERCSLPSCAGMQVATLTCIETVISGMT